MQRVDAQTPLYDARYRLQAEIGSGGSGYVWRAFDTETGAEVALKRVVVYSTAHRARVRREIAALRLLQIPGVVRLIDVGEVDAEPYLAMELLKGTPFPGAGAEGDWQVVTRRAMDLCATLERVHTLGVVHRDLKPANVIVEPDGRVVLLDFGLARGERLSDTVTEHGGIVGSLGYLAPEQLRGGLPDLRADLYALGVMLYEALGGRPVSRDVSALRAFARGLATELPRPPLDGVPEDLAALVAELTQADADRRPASARLVAERLAALLGMHLPPAVEVPLVGREAEIEEVLRRLARGEAVAVWGAQGSGKTRVLVELQARLEAEGRTVARLAAGARPFQALLDWIGPIPEGPGGLALAADRMRERVAGGLVLLVDDLDQHDIWTRRVVERLATEGGAIVRVAKRPDAVFLPALGPDVLRSLFRGPDAFVHLREDGARLLHLRTAGVARRVERELRNWLAVGRAEWDLSGGTPRLGLTRGQLDELEAWPGLVVHGLGGAVQLKLETPLAEVLAWLVLAGPIPVETLTEAMAIPAWELDLELEELESLGHLHRRGDGRVEALVLPVYLDGLSEDRLATMHRRLARVRPDEPEERLRHWLACGDHELAVEAAIEAAEAHVDAARLGRAKGLYAAALRAARTANRDDLGARALTGYVAVALSDLNLTGAEEAQRYAERRADALGERLATLARAVADAARGRWGSASELVQGLEPFASDGLEAVRLGVRVRCANLGHTEPVDELLASLEAASAATPAGRCRFLGWTGLAAYSAARYPEAVAAHEAALAVAPTPFRRVVARLNLCVALLEVFELRRVCTLAAELEAQAAALRLPNVERWAFVLRTGAEYRLGEGRVPRPEVLHASALVSRDLAHANLLMTAAAHRWRSGNPAEAAELAAAAGRTARAVNRDDIATLPEALHAYLTEDAEAAVPLLRAARGLPPRLRGQSVALLSALVPVPEEVVGLVRATPATPPGIRLEVLDWAEVLAYLRASSGASDVGPAVPDRV